MLGRDGIGWQGEECVLKLLEVKQYLDPDIQGSPV